MVKKKRNLPAHIVLPNGMWRFVKKGTKPKKARMARRLVSRKVVRMARRRYRAKAARAYGKGSNIAMSGLMPKGGLFGLVGKVLMGAGAASINDKLPQFIPYQKYAAAGAVAGIPGVAGAFLRDMATGTSSAGSAGQW